MTLIEQYKAEHPWGAVGKYYLTIPSSCVDFVRDGWYETSWVGEDEDVLKLENEVTLFRTKEEALAHIRAKILSDLYLGARLGFDMPIAEAAAPRHGVEIPQEYKDKRKAQLLKELARYD